MSRCFHHDTFTQVILPFLGKRRGRGTHQHNTVTRGEREDVSARHSGFARGLDVGFDGIDDFKAADGVGVRARVLLAGEGRCVIQKNRSVTALRKRSREQNMTSKWIRSKDRTVYDVTEIIAQWSVENRVDRHTLTVVKTKEGQKDANQDVLRVELNKP